jgi:hypothetical protein
MYCERLTLTLTVDASGDATVYSAQPVNGRVLQLRYVPDGTNPLATGADLTITGESTGVAVATLVNIGTSAFTTVPRQATHGVDGSASLYAAGGEPVEDPVYVAGERLKVVVAQGGNAKTGTLHVLIG